MSEQKLRLGSFPWNERYRLSCEEEVLTPTLLIYPDLVTSNIECTLRLLEGDVDRWRPHVKTAKLGFTMRMLIERGVRNFKCATSLELLVACESGAADVLLAYPAMGANAQRARRIGEQFPGVRVSALVENHSQLTQWHGSPIGIFLDINTGMNRTGIDPRREGEIIDLLRAVSTAGLHFRGLHFYDGQYGSLAQYERCTAAEHGYQSLLELVRKIQRSIGPVPEVITAGTPTFPCSITYDAFRKQEFTHRVSPGTIVYCDTTSLAQLPAEYGYAPAALILSRVVSQPQPNIFTCDAGHKTVSADAGVPTCVVLGHPEVVPLGPSEEHLPLRADNAAELHVGDLLYLLPRHICPTVNDFSSALLVRNGEIQSVEEVSARGREGPLLRRQ